MPPRLLEQGAWGGGGGLTDTVASPSSTGGRGDDGPKRARGSSPLDGYQLKLKWCFKRSTRLALQERGPSCEPCGEKTFGMVVIARFPRLDPTAAAACSAVPVVSMAVAATPALAPSDGTVPRAPRGSVVAAVPGRSRAPRARFPAVSTLVLAVVAGMFWAAVWREEQRRAAEDGNRDREAVAREPDGEAGLIR